MVDSFMSFSNQNSMDIFPSFKSFHEPKDDQGAFTIDNKDIEEIKKPIPTKSKQNNPTSDHTKKTNSNPLAQCDICLVPISSQIVYDTHIKGKKHQAQLTGFLSKNPQYKAPTYEELCSKKQETIITNNQNEKTESSSSESNNTVPPLIPSKKLNCHTCNISCNSQQMFDNHVSGRKHQIKLKLTSFTNPAPPRSIPDNNPSSSNYCDICSLKLNSEDELTEHLSQPRHQTRVKEAETCAKEAVDMNINFDDYKISTVDTEKDILIYQCTICDKKFRNKMQLINHLKSASHNRLSNQSNNQRLSRNSNQGNHQVVRRGVMRGGTATRGQSFSSSRGSNKPSGKPNPYRSQQSSWNQPSQSIDQQPSNNPFGAFDPTNQYYYPSTKRPTQYEDIPNEYDGFYPKRSRTYNEGDNNSQDYYSNDTNYYSSNSNQTSVSQPSWQYQTEPYYDQQQYTNSGTAYINPMYYPSNQPPLPNYEPPPLPNYPPVSSHTSSAFYGGTENQGNTNFFPTSFHQ